MPKNRDLIDLFRAIGAHDLEAASGIAAALWRSEEQKGHRTAARLLRGALSSNGDSTARLTAPRELIRPIESAEILSAALVRLRGKTELSEVSLRASVRAELEQILHEWKERSLLAKKGVSRRSKLIFHGPPGCGKSLTARALGSALGLPVFMVRFDAVVGAFLGQTAIHLRQLFSFAETTPCVLLFDELDALGKRRGNPLDVGELDRIVISLMQELEHSKPQGLIICTSNLPTHLDDALWRRFDLAISFPAPDRRTLGSFVRRLASERKLRLSKKTLNRAIRADSYAAAEAIVIDELRKQILGRGRSK